MDKPQLKILALCVAIGLLLGATHRYVLGLFSAEDAANPAAAPAVELPEGGVQSDVFSLNLLQAALAQQEKGNACVAPLATAELLDEMQQAAGGSTRTLIDERLKALKLTPADQWQEFACRPALLCTLVADDSLSPATGTEPAAALRLPLHRDTAKALALLNGLEAEATATPYGHFLSGEDLTADTRLAAILSQSLEAQWQIPMGPAPAHERDFYSADGGLRATDMLAGSGMYRLAAAADGSWQAAALFLRSGARSGKPACYIAIMPKGGDPRAFVRGLTAEKLSEIRTALAKAAPQQATVYLPAPALPQGTRNLQALLLELGMGKLFTQGADFAAISAEPLHLDLAAARYALDIGSGEHAPAPAAGAELRFNQPFLWLIADLTSATPPLLMGWEESR